MAFFALVGVSQGKNCHLNLSVFQENCFITPLSAFTIFTKIGKRTTDGSALMVIHLAFIMKPEYFTWYTSYSYTDQIHKIFRL